MKEILMEQYNRTKQLLIGNRAQQKLLIDGELALASRLVALEDVIREGQQKEQQAAQMKKKEEKNKAKANSEPVKCPLGCA